MVDFLNKNPIATAIVGLCALAIVVGGVVAVCLGELTFPEYLAALTGTLIGSGILGNGRAKIAAAERQATAAVQAAKINVGGKR